MPTVEQKPQPHLTLEQATEAYLKGDLEEEEFERIEAEHAPNYVESARALAMSRSSWGAEPEHSRFAIVLRILFGKR